MTAFVRDKAFWKLLNANNVFQNEWTLLILLYYYHGKKIIAYAVKEVDRVFFIKLLELHMYISFLSHYVLMSVRLWNFKDDGS